jgi:SAM-dependent methyltransferase
MTDKRRARRGQRRGTDGAEALDGRSSLVTARAFDSIYARRCRDRLIDRLDLESVAEPEAREWATTAFIGPGEPAELCRVLSRAREAGRPQFTILDLGCGTGGIGRYVAKRLDAEVWGGRACNAWRSALEDAGFEVRAWADRSRRWRALMRRKHERRLAAASRLLAADGPEIGAELAVSRTMLGLNGEPAFLDRHRRLWVWAAKA